MLVLFFCLVIAPTTTVCFLFVLYRTTTSFHAGTLSRGRIQCHGMVPPRMHVFFHYRTPPSRTGVRSAQPRCSGGANLEGITVCCTRWILRKVSSRFFTLTKRNSSIFSRKNLRFYAWQTAPRQPVFHHYTSINVAQLALVGFSDSLFNALSSPNFNGAFHNQSGPAPLRTVGGPQ